MQGYVKNFWYDLFKQLPVGIGERMGNSIHFTEADADAVVGSICERLDLCKVPEEPIVFNVVVKGVTPYWLSAILTGELKGRGDVKQFKILHPNGSCYVIFPRK